MNVICSRVGSDSETEAKERMSPGDQHVAGTVTFSILLNAVKNDQGSRKREEYYLVECLLL